MKATNFTSSVLVFLAVCSIGTTATLGQEVVTTTKTICGTLWQGDWSFSKTTGPARLEILCNADNSLIIAYFTVEKTGKSKDKKQEWAIAGSVKDNTVTFPADWGTTTLNLTRKDGSTFLNGEYSVTRSKEKGKYNLTLVQ